MLFSMQDFLKSRRAETLTGNVVHRSRSSFETARPDTSLRFHVACWASKMLKSAVAQAGPRNKHLVSDYEGALALIKWSVQHIQQ